MAEYMMFKCDYCGSKSRGLPGSGGPRGWFLVQQQGEEKLMHFCTQECLVMYGHDKADYSSLPKAERLRTALQSLGFLPKADSKTKQGD